MKAGIFIPGLGEAFPGTTIKGYAQRLANEMDYANPVQLNSLLQKNALNMLETVPPTASPYGLKMAMPKSANTGFMILVTQKP